MNKPLLILALLGFCSLTSFADDPALTIYNENFAVVRDTVPLDLTQGENTPPPFADITAHLEPDSVILRDPSGKVKLQVLEQNYRNDPVSQELLLSLFEGKTIDFLVKTEGKPDQTIQGKIIRSGYAGHSQMAMQGDGDDDDSDNQPAIANSEPIIDVDGKVQFGLPGQPIFPSLGDDTILKPQLAWKLYADAPAKLNAEIAYVTGGMSWEASYNIVEPDAAKATADSTDEETVHQRKISPDGDLIDVIGWITMDNQSGKTFNNAKIKLMAGNVNKIQNPQMVPEDQVIVMTAVPQAAPAPVTEKAFDEYHLYSLPRPTTLHDGETKQVEFIHATGVKSQRIYIYDGANLNGYGNWSMEDVVTQDPDFGKECTNKIAVIRQFKNSDENHLGLPLPKGRVRFYKQDDTQLEFTGENSIDHTPKDELVKLYTGDAFDLVGERKQTNFHGDQANQTVDESFQIKLRNHKKEPVTIEVDEHLYRYANWKITKSSDPFEKTDSQQMKFEIPVKPDEERTVTYTVHYTW